MKLKKTSFLAIHGDGLVLLDGHAFKVNGRDLVVHKARPKLIFLDPNYRVSASAGFPVPISQTRDQREAVHFASIEVPKISEQEWANRCEMSEQAKKNLQVVEG